ncbi:GGDEF domain-containing protein [Pseudoalteromonas spongiae]|uniref:tetratricopeptide repeat-containing diguanylate cyclase n=1 Tax=Pseudoalteromonas spongiae TaxID=298657 RepID=UPI000C2D6685|nr:GGDEF domain-containing protein [Pseudoalteromonas spongiae]
MPLIVFLFCVLFAAALDATEIKQATQQNISAHIQKQSNLTFSNYENRIEQLSLKHNQDNLEMLAALNQFNEQNPTNNLNDLAYLLSYRCYLELVNNQQHAYQRTEQSLLALTISSASDPAISAATSFYKSWRYYFEKDAKQYDLYIEQSFNYALNAQTPVLKYWIAISFAMMAQDTGRHSAAIEAAKLAMTIANVNKDNYREATSRAIIAISEAELGFFDDALINNQWAIDWYKSVDQQNAILGLYQNRGFILNSQGNTAQAKAIYLDAIEQAKKLENQDAIHEIYSNLAAIAFTEGELALSNDYAKKTLQYAQQSDYQTLAAHAYSIMAINNVYLNQLDLALEYFDKGNSYFEEYKMISLLADNYKSWSEAMASIENFEAAYKAQLRYKELSDKIFNTERESRMLRIKELYEVAQKDQEIEQLAFDNQRKNTEIENKSLQKKIWVLSAVITLLAFIILSFFYRKLNTSNKKLTKHNTKLNEERFIDPLTESLNRRFFEVQQRERMLNLPEVSFSLFALDIDHFKSLNDTYGHACGDQVLKQFCQRIRQSIRQQDNLIRMGGEEFLLVIENSNLEADAQLIKKLLTITNSEPITFELHRVSISVSIGAASNVNIYDETTLDFALELADQALYKAKLAGRNQGELLDLYQINLASVINNYDMIVSKTVTSRTQ